MITESRKTRAHVSKTLILLAYTLAILGIYFVAVATYSPSSTSGGSLLTHVAESSYAMRQSLYVLVSPLVLAFMLGVSRGVGGNPAVDAFGCIAMIAMTPLIAIQLLGIIFSRKTGEHK